MKENHKLVKGVRKTILRYFTNLVQELKMENTESFKEMLMMSYEDLKKLLNSIEQHNTPNRVNDRNKVTTTPKRLALTLRFLAIG